MTSPSASMMVDTNGSGPSVDGQETSDRPASPVLKEEGHHGEPPWRAFSLFEQVSPAREQHLFLKASYLLYIPALMFDYLKISPNYRTLSTTVLSPRGRPRSVVSKVNRPT